MKKPNVPFAIERKVERLQSRVKELERVCKMAHDTIADVAGILGVSQTQIDLDSTFRELVRVLFIDK